MFGGNNKQFAAKKKEQDKQRAYRKNKLFRRIEADIKERDRRRIPGTNFTTYEIVIL